MQDIAKMADTLLRDMGSLVDARDYAARIGGYPGPLAATYQAIARELNARIDANRRWGDSDAIQRIADLLSGSEWNGDTLAEVAEIVRQTGRDVSDID